MKLFCLKHSDFQCSSSICYRGLDITEAEFKRLCDSLLPDAARSALAKQRNSQEPCSVYWSDVLEELDLMLQSRGFEKIDFAEVEYTGWEVGSVSNELLGEDNVKAIKRFNQGREDEFHAEIEHCRHFGRCNE